MLSVFRGNVVDLPTNFSLSYFWCGGFMLSIFMVLQLVSGIILSFLYVADSGMSFSCVLDFVSEGVFLWFVRYLHIWGVSAIFLLFILHMGRSLYYSSYNMLGVWNVGFALYLLMMVEAFLGYILPWHQMSYWAATVLTSILNSIPLFGADLYKFIVGGFGVTNVTLTRVFSAHVCLAFIIVGVSVLHLFYLHASGSNNPVFFSYGYFDAVYFHPLFTFKDGLLLSILIFFLFLSLLLFPDGVLDVESYIEADPMVTPASIKPEWYFLPFYAMLRSVESKMGGLVLVLVFLFVLWLPLPAPASSYSEARQFLFWWCLALFFLLGYLGACHPETPYVEWSKVGSVSVVLSMVVFKSLYVGSGGLWGGGKATSLQ